ncbi:MAG: hypothetical protein ChlgKO_10920 [Chlamydiales bacterium]
MQLNEVSTISLLACSTVIYRAALQSVAPYSLNTTKKIAYFIGAEAFVTISLQAFPLHQIIKRAFTQEKQTPTANKTTQIALFVIANSIAATLFRKSIPTISSYKLAFSFIAFGYIYSSILKTFGKHIFKLIRTRNTPSIEVSESNQLVHRVTQVGILTLLLISYIQKKAFKQQVSSLSSDATRNLKIANFATFAFGIIVFRYFLSKTVEVAFPNYVW